MEGYSMKDFEQKIRFYIGDNNAIITGSEVRKNSIGSTCLYVTYTISKDYAEENELYYLNREMCIILQRSEGDESTPITSYAIR